MGEAEWGFTTLGQITTKIGSGATPRGGSSVYVHAGTAFIRSQNVLDFHFSDSGLAYITEDAAEALRGVSVSDGDVLVNITGDSVARVCAAPKIAARVSQHVAIVRPDPQLGDSRFIMYSLLNPPMKARLLNTSSSGATRKALTKEHLQSLPVALPPLSEQRRIAGVLGALDDLIEVNRGLIRDQFDLARAVFSREATKTDEFLALGDLYSAGLSGVWGEDQAGGSATEEVAVLRGRDLEDVWAVNALQAPRRYLSAKQVASRRPEIGEIWTAGSGSLGPSLAVLEDLPKLFGQSTVLYSNFVKRLVPNRGPSWFGPAWLSMIEAWQSGRFENYRTGTAMPNLDTDALLRGVEVPDLSSASRALVNRLVRAALDPSLREEILELERARDELLPLLMSGRVRVGEVGAA